MGPWAAPCTSRPLVPRRKPRQVRAPPRASSGQRDPAERGLAPQKLKKEEWEGWCLLRALDQVLGTRHCVRPGMQPLRADVGILRATWGSGTAPSPGTLRPPPYAPRTDPFVLLSFTPICLPVRPALGSERTTPLGSLWRSPYRRSPGPGLP